MSKKVWITILFLLLALAVAASVVIARAIAQGAQTLILDEPTNHLDIRHQLFVMDYLKQSGKDTLLVIHDLRLAAHYCDYLYMICDGRVYAQGTPEEVLCTENVHHVFGVQGYAAEAKRGTQTSSCSRKHSKTSALTVGCRGGCFCIRGRRIPKVIVYIMFSFPAHNNPLEKKEERGLHMIITIVCDVLGEENNGTTLAAMNLIRALRAKGHTVTILCPDAQKQGVPG